jgi:hypothetical protein
MKNIKKITLIAGIISASLMGSCKKEFLELEPYTQIPGSEAASTVANMTSALNGAYYGLINTNLYGRTLPVFGDLLGDNVFVSVANSGRYLNEQNYSITVNDGDVSGIWNTSYNDILRANNVISSTITGDGVDQMRGEAYALRALNYFNLVRLFAKPYTDDPAALGVPLVLAFDPNPPSDWVLPARNTVGEVYAQILSDLDNAYTLMSTYRGSSYFSKYAARALQAKVNLYKGDYQSAYDQANDVIVNGGFTLVSAAGLPAYFAAQDPASGKVETLFQVASDPVNNNSYDELVAIYQQDGTYGDLLTTKSLYDLYSAEDVRKELIVEGVRNKTAGEDPAYLVMKYSNENGNYGVKKVLRLSDVYLMRAEAAARLGKPDALTTLNALMAQRDPSLVYASTGQQLLNDIITERRKELAFEGDRFFDLNRLKLPIQRTVEYPTGPIPYGSNKRVLPIPQNELNVNPNIVQNPL